MHRSSFLILMLLLSGLAPSAEIYRCTGASGEPAFGQRPCGEQGDPVVLQAPAGQGTGGLRASERAWLAARERPANSGDRGRRPPGSGRASDGNRAARQAYQCERRRHALDAVKTALRRGYRPARGERLRRRRRAHEDYLAAFCP